MKKSKESTVNIGRRSIYNFHVGNNMSQKINMEFVQIWYPKNTIQEEYYILKCIRMLADNKDGIASLYMTYDTPVCKNTDGSIRYSTQRKYILESVNRAKKRFEDLKQRGLIAGTYTNPELTFSGSQKLDAQIDNFDAIHSSIQDLVLAVKELSIDTKDIICGLDNIVEHMSEKSSVKDCMESINTTFDFICNSVKLANFAVKIAPYATSLINLLQCNFVK